MEKAKPTMFIGSSTESIAVARVLQAQLHDDVIATVWDQGLIDVGEYVLDGLLRATSEFDFAAFIFGADDTAVVRGDRYIVARDNVVLELGMFAGRLGRERTFMVEQRTSTPIHLPSDLSGVVRARFEWPEGEPLRDYTKLNTAIGPAVQGLRAAIEKRGPNLAPLTTLSAGMVFLVLCLNSRGHSLLELTRKFRAFQRLSQRVPASEEAEAYASKAAKYGCQCLEAIGLVKRYGGDEYGLTDVGRALVKSRKLESEYPTAFTFFDAASA